MDKFKDSDEGKEVFVRAILRKSYDSGIPDAVALEVESLGVLRSDCTGNTLILAIDEERVHRCKKTVSYQITE